MVTEFPFESDEIDQIGFRPLFFFFDLVAGRIHSKLEENEEIVRKIKRQRVENQLDPQDSIIVPQIDVAHQMVLKHFNKVYSTPAEQIIIIDEDEENSES